MRANWSLILNILLLVGVVVAIGRMMNERRKSNAPTPPVTPASPVTPSVGITLKENFDDIISVRKINSEPAPAPATITPAVKPEMSPVITSTPQQDNAKPKLDSGSSTSASASAMIFLLAKDNRQLAGYELLQTLLATGLRFGEGQLFHRHQNTNGQGPVLCSLAAATASGVFDLQNIGAFSVRGLCLFMQASGHAAIDTERFAIMLDTAKQLSEELDTYLLDEQRKPLSENSLKRYYQSLNITQEINEQTEVA